jgi:hydroxymethylpyrimidine/phosphomethylpyrimidine kinase
MSTKQTNKPIVLVLAGHDPSGGAGIQADIETVSSIGAAAVSIITSLTAQNTQVFGKLLPQQQHDFTEQAQLIFTDMQISACKIGAIGHFSLVEAINNILGHQELPVVLDPVLQSTTGYDLVNEELCQAICTMLLPIATLITPNRAEALQLTDELEPAQAAKKLLTQGCQSVLITGEEETESIITNRLYTNDNNCRTYIWERLPGEYHGSGCTLSSAITALLALNIDIMTAVEQAQQYTWNTLKHGVQYGRGQLHPDRFYWHLADNKLFKP